MRDASPTSKRIRRPAAETRQQVLDAAEELFYWQGIHATGVDKIAASAGIAAPTLYRLFPSKADLVAAYVDRSADGYRAWIEEITVADGRTAGERIVAFFEALAALTGPEAFRGCPFLMALAEYPDPASAPHRSAQAIKAWVRDKLRALTREVPVRSRKADVLADQLALLVEGLYASTAALGQQGPARQAPALADLLITTACA
jgi:AcrR family transcriptional regulator